MVISLGSLTNPSISGSAGTFTVATYLTDDGGSNYYLVDTGTYSSITITTGTLTSPSVTSNNTVASSSGAAYTISFATQHSVVQNGYITITFPSEITISDTSSAVAGCQAGVNTGGTTSSVACTATSSSLVVTNLYSSAAQNGTVYVLIPGITNRRSLATSGSFTVTTSDNSNVVIDTLSSGFTITMASVSNLQGVSIQNTNTTAVNGYFDSYKVIITAQTSTVSGDKLVLQFPTTFTFPTSTANLA